MTSPNAAANTNAGEKSLVYLDYAASAPMSEAALEAERAYEAAPFAGANPNSLHTLGRQAARALDGARRDLARCLGAGFRPSDVVFTSGGTESNNLALWGLAEGARQRDRKRTRVLVSAIEHDSALDALPTLRDRGFDVELLRPGRDGVVSPETVEAALDDTVALVSVMSANNETGVLQPVGAIARLAHAAGALMHTDAAQAFARVPLEVDDCDAVSIAAHKIGGETMHFDGHCIYSPDGNFITGDGYWDRNHNRHWKIVRLADEEIRDIGDFFVPPAYRNIYCRCDLHPRWRSDGRQLAFNSVHEGSRQIYLIDVKPGKVGP